MCAWKRVRPCVLHIIPIWLAAWKRAIPGCCSLKGCSPIGGSPSVCSPVRHSNLTDGGAVALRNAGWLEPEVSDFWPQVVRARSTVPYNRWMDKYGPGLSWESFRRTSSQFQSFRTFFFSFFFFPVFVCSTSEGGGRHISWSSWQKVWETIKPSKPVTAAVPFINISCLSEIEWKSLLVRRSPIPSPNICLHQAQSVQ